MAASALLILALLSASASAAPAPPPPSSSPSTSSCAYATLAASAPAWLALLESTGAGPLLRGEAPLRGGLTLFAPTDAALARAGVLDSAWAPGGTPNGTATGVGGLPLRPGSVASLLASAPATGPVLVAAHAVRGALSRSDLERAGGTLPTLATRKLAGRPDERLGIALEGGGATPSPLLTSVGGVTAAVVGPEEPSCGGGSGGNPDITVFIVDAVLLPFPPFRGGGSDGGGGGD
jgi:hypothetical protein